MNKVIKIPKNICLTKKKDINNIVHINNNLAITLGYSTFLGVPKRRAFRKYIIEITKSESFCVSGKDIKRLEQPGKREIPVNIVDILEAIISNVIDKRNEYNYRAPSDNNQIISVYALEKTLNHLSCFYTYINDKNHSILPENEKYRDAIQYVTERLNRFNARYPYIFNHIFN